MPNVHQLRVSENLKTWKPGEILSPPYLTDTGNLSHGVDRAKQQYSVVVPATPDPETTYSYSVEGEEVAYTTSDAPDDEELRDGLLGIHNENPLARGLFEAEESGTDTILLNGLQTREQFTVEAGEGDLTVTEVEEAFDGGDFEIARAVYYEGNELSADKPAGDIEDVLAGIAAYRYDEEKKDIGGRGGDQTLEIPAYFDVYYVRRGVVGVQTAPDATKGGVVYVGVDGDDEGQFFAEDSADRTEVPRSVLSWDGPNRLQLKLA